jgi:hypothetical protein
MFSPCPLGVVSASSWSRVALTAHAIFLLLFVGCLLVLFELCAVVWCFDL